MTNETITYTYDALKRLLRGSGSNWTENYVYDGYGNLTQMNPSGTATGMPSMQQTVVLANNVPTNQLGSASQYDSNGNLITTPGVVYQYDNVNRISEVMTSGNSYYNYDSDNHRIYYKNISGIETIYFYGADGSKLGAYTYTITTGSTPIIQFTQQSVNVYFTGILVQAEGGSNVQLDRLGSVTQNSTGNHRYYPYGIEYSQYSGTANDTEKYGTYTRDSVSGLDYAMNRYYSSQWGRFLSPDPSGKSIAPENPQSWNRYAYVNGDPVNRADPMGLYLTAEECIANPAACEGEDWGNSGDLWGGNGGGCQDISASQFDPTPPPPSPNPCSPPDPPPLECEYGFAIPGPPIKIGVSADNPAAGALPGYFLPISFSFKATGGSGAYTWTNTQNVSTSGFAQYCTGGIGACGIFNLGGTSVETLPESYSTDPTDGAPGRYTVSDTPGLVSPTRFGHITAAIAIFNFQLNVSVTDALGQTAQCPPVWWQAWEIWVPRSPNGPGTPYGQAYVVSVDQ